MAKIISAPEAAGDKSKIRQNRSATKGVATKRSNVLAAISFHSDFMPLNRRPAPMHSNPIAKEALPRDLKNVMTTEGIGIEAKLTINPKVVAIIKGLVTIALMVFRSTLLFPLVWSR